MLHDSRSRSPSPSPNPNPCLSTGHAARHAAERHLQRAPAFDPRQCACASPTWLTCTWLPSHPLHAIPVHPACAYARSMCMHVHHVHVCMCMCMCMPPCTPTPPGEGGPLRVTRAALARGSRVYGTPSLALPGGRIHGFPRDGGEHLAAVEEQLPQLVHTGAPRSAAACRSSPQLASPQLATARQLRWWQGFVGAPLALGSASVPIRAQ